MPEPRAQRTLVKSPPELWAEISDVSTLARHLGEFGEIRITRLEAETTVVWEGDRARGTVELEPSGWGTKVTITAAAVEAPPEPAPEPAAVTEAAEVAEAAEEPVMLVEPEPEPEPEPVVVAEPEAAAVVEPEPVDEPVAEAEPVSVPEPAREPKRGFFARLFRRREAAPVAAEPVAAEPEPEPIAVAEPEPEPEPEPVPVEPEPMTLAEPEPVVVAEPEPVAIAEPIAALEPEPAAQPLDDERVEAVLVSVLDDLGSAHHRPFSRG
jgi:hypothetical protein